MMGCNNILSMLNIKADDNYHPSWVYTVSFSAKHVCCLVISETECIEFLDRVRIKMLFLDSLKYYILCDW